MKSWLSVIRMRKEELYFLTNDYRTKNYDILKNYTKFTKIIVFNVMKLSMKIED